MGTHDQMTNGTTSAKSKEKLEMQQVKKMDSNNREIHQTYQKPLTSNKHILVALLAVGLVLYLTDIGLHITIASKYLTMRNCSRNVKHTISNFSLNNVVDLNKALGDISADLDDNEEEETDINNFNEYDQDNETKLTQNKSNVKLEDSKSTTNLIQENLQKIISLKLDEFITDNIYVKLREKVFKILPEHWKQRIIDIVTFQVGRHNISSIPDICVLNEQSKLNRLSEMALYICSNTLENGSLDSPEGKAIRNALFELVPTRIEEDNLIKHAMNGDFIYIIYDILERNFNSSTVERVRQVMELFQNTFNEPGELKSILGLLSDPKIIANIGNLTSALGSIDPEHLNGAAGALAKIDAKNMGVIEDLLGQLNITLGSLITDPTIFLSFLGDPAKGKILVELQKYLPQFEPTEINDFLTIKLELDKHLGADAKGILENVLKLPMSLLRKVSCMNN